MSLPECEPFLPLLAGALDGELTEAERVSLDAHLRGCERCREALAREQALVLRLEGLPVGVLERDAWPAVAASLEARAASARAERRESPLVWMALAAVLLSFRGLDLGLFGGVGVPLRLVALLLVVVLFLVVRANPFRLATDRELAMSLGESR
jgi:anti-sigma factor RsiW